ncbi:hypothetical protein M0805_005620 [Coniferiporia weirii]|nr:hypothetical protein M0805_005620 [Coniferiporia weirii]
MKVLVLGATGFIGLPVAQAFVRNGHEVYGQTRNASKAKLLLSEELTPVVADPSKAEEWSEYAEKADIVVDSIGGMDIEVLSQKVFDIASEAAKKARGSSALKMAYIHCSGTWVHGEDRINTASERALPKNTTALVSWRPEQEQRVLASTIVHGIVVRPSMLYGRSGSITTMLFAAAAAAGAQGGVLEWGARAGGRWSLIHVDDLAGLFVRVAEAVPVCKGLVFDATNDYSESVDDILASVARISGASSWAYREPANLFEEAIGTTTLLLPSLARALVGWRPLKPSLVDGLSAYYAVYKAHI